MIVLKEKLIEKMKSKNLSIPVLERKAGLTLHSLRNILKGTIKKPRAEVLSAVAEALECSLIDLIDTSSSTSNSWQRNNIMKKKNDYLEHSTFMAACASVVASLLEEKGLTLSFNDYFSITTTLYLYSLPKDPRKPDIKFAKWLLEEGHMFSGRS